VASVKGMLFTVMKDIKFLSKKDHAISSFLSKLSTVHHLQAGSVYKVCVISVIITAEKLYVQTPCKSTSRAAAYPVA
jgi:SepF-like predicted cell division protein (DUF552 family)